MGARPALSRFAWPLVAALLALHFLLAMASSRHDSCTFDELVFLAGGVSQWEAGDYRLNPDGAPLAQRWAAWPVVATGGTIRSPHPQNSVEAKRLAEQWSRSDAWSMGRQLLYGSANDPARMLLLARGQIALLSVLLGLIVFAWSRRLFGLTGGFISLTLYTFSPAFLAHGRLVTADLAASLFLVAATWATWRALARLSLATLATSCACVAGLFLAKMSAVLIIPITGLLLLARLIARRPLVVAFGRNERVIKRPLAQVAALVPVLVLHVAVVVLAIWVAFSFRYEAFAPGSSGIMRDGGWATIKDAGWCERPVTFAREHRLLPEAWLFGFQYSVKHSHARHAYALGKYAMTGWWWFFPLAILVKTPMAALALLLLAAVALVASRRRAARDALDALELLPPLMLAGVYMAVAMLTHLNIGLRHVLPVLPALLVLTGACAGLVSLHRHARLALGTLVVLAAAEGVLAYPDYIGYFNAAGGPAARRWRVLVDSSLDWGQNLPTLKAWLAEARAAGDASPAYLSYFGSADPIDEGLDVTLLPGFLDLRRAERGAAAEPLRPGLYCVSATMLVQVFSNFPGTWAQPYEDTWRHASSLSDPFLMADEPTRRMMSGDRGGEYWPRLFSSYEQLRLARLCAYLRHREPDAVMGAGGLLVWRLSQADLDAALKGPPAELVAEPVNLPWAGSIRR